MTKHRSFGSDRANLVYGQAADGSLVHISVAKKGLACQCMCPGGCGSELIARKRAATPHFAHRSLHECTTAPETALHKLAKQIISDAKILVVPERIATYGSETAKLSDLKEIQLDSVRMEARDFSSIVPDLYVTAKGRELLVEIFVTHVCDEDKVALIRSGGIAALEIDLSRIKRDAAPEAVKEAVIRSAPRKWLFNQTIEEKISSMKSEAEAILVEKERKIQNEALEKVRRYRKVSLQPYECQDISCREMFITIGVEEYIGIEFPGNACFVTKPAHWQSIVLNDLLFERSTGNHLITPVGALKYLTKHRLVRNEFRYLKKDIEAAASEIEPTFAATWRAVEAYLEYLYQNELVHKMHHGFALKDFLHSKGFEWKLEEEERQNALDNISKIVTDFLNQVPPEERGDVTSESWLSKKASGHNKTYRQLIEAKDTRRQIERGIESIDRALAMQTGDPVDLLDLPIAKELARRLAKKEQRRVEREQYLADLAEKRRTDRQKEVEVYASKVLSEIDCRRWINEANSGLNGQTPLCAAYNNVEGMEEAKNILFRIEQKQKAETNAQPWHEKLEKEAIQQLGNRYLAFLNGRDDDFHRQTARDFCRCEHTYEKAIEKLELWVSEFKTKKR